MSPLNMLRKRVLILGGYGTFGSRIAEMLSDEPGLHIILAGHDRFKATLLADRLQQQPADGDSPACTFEGLRLDHHSVNLAAQLKALNLDLLIHCAGPFQQQGYHVPEACIANGIHYLDIADATEFVGNIATLDQRAIKSGASVISGASSLPALSSAVLKVLSASFTHIEDVDISIAPAHRISRGLATVRAGFESLGKTLTLTRDGQPVASYAGDDLRKVTLGHPVGKRLVCNFDVPDLKLAPEHMPGIKNLHFGTGVQPRPLQWGLALCARLARIRRPTFLPDPLPHFARLGHWLAARWPGGSNHGGMLIEVSGELDGRRAQARWQILGLNGDGPWIPAAPAAAMARKLIHSARVAPGARPCWQLLSLDEILRELAPYSVVTSVELPDS
ncbi:saccharopine dehydrogenase NADP-binding domain-containing protein [Microbulbifer salipaludis]|uniref:Saccharopine dehydrogenase NADP-binding domain-containing protein n=1 Tax=Microbulbifer salipaludis TaxID=187980 RepID=A0ABS3E991_9GAMM|nr:saccharopine dehydrogenase NADP-binding domain-containing protein [Microbulbifer salipaludis]MBN8431866.1 saccharopine dehydrogenase NADP-binding domain-containing protein [Microbulbifer salipaludis]